jgi:hypothetical protein
VPANNRDKRYDDPVGRLVTTGRNRRDLAEMITRREREFVIWDGEGATEPGRRNDPQQFVLFGCYTGTEHRYIVGPSLTTYECLALIMRVARELGPDGYTHVSFAFGYDTNMILRHLSGRQLRRLSERGFVFLGTKDAWRYRVEHVPGKWLRVTEYGSNYQWDRDDKLTVTIYDGWGFFQSSFIAAVESYLPDHPLLPEVQRGKEQRQVFQWADIDFITAYWKVENELGHALFHRLRELLYDVGLFITSWHGPGALASYVYNKHRVQDHKVDCGPVIYDAARYAYAGGRFERFHIGRYEQAYGYDINSAYPTAIAKLPSLTEGFWRHRRHLDAELRTGADVAEFGLYRLDLRGYAIKRDAAPLFHRDSNGDVTFPWRLSGWYWSPEVAALLDTLPEYREHIVISEAWEYHGWETRPFGFVADMYEQRRMMKAAGIGSQIALKLCLNSLYGKQAQRAGWERNGGAPRWHQLEWAGWVTSHTRATLYRLMQRMGYDNVIAVETDGVYSSLSPDVLGITDSSDLGGWEVSAYDELVYLQSGVYAKRQGDQWSVKYRGLDRDTFGNEPTQQEAAAHAIVEHSKLLVPGTRDWPKLEGVTTRFIGYRNALFREQQGRGALERHHCVWEREPKAIDCGSVGKRIHSPRICTACQAGATAYDMPHETIIRSRMMLPTEPFDYMSHRHDIPWLDADHEDWWRQQSA